MVRGIRGGIPWSLLRHSTRIHQHFIPVNRNPLYSTKSPPLPTQTPTIIAATSLLPSNACFFNPSRMCFVSPFSTAVNFVEDGDEKDGRSQTQKDLDYDSDLPDVNDLLAELRREEKRKMAEREERKLKGEEDQEQEEDEEDTNYMGMGVIKDEEDKEKGEEEGGKRWSTYVSDDDADDDDFLDPADLKVAQELDDKKLEQYTKRCIKYNAMLESLRKSSTFDEAYKWMDQIDRFQAEHFAPPNEYKVLGWLLNRLSEATGKERFILQMKIQRALKHLRWKEEFNPHNPDNWGVMKSGKENTAEDDKLAEDDKEEKNKENKENDEVDEDDEYTSDEEDIEEALSEQVRSIDRDIKKKLAEMELTFGKQSRDLEEEIKELVGQRQSLTVKKDLPLYRKGFEVKLIDVNRTCKVTKGGQVQKYSSIVAVGNFNGIVGYGKAKGRAAASAIQRAHVKSFENLHYIERYKEHTLAHAIQAKFKKTKLYLWPGAINTGMRANKTVESILYLAGLRNVKSKVIGSRNAENTVKALFKALNMIETPQDIQEKFGRSVVESYLLK